MCVWYLNMCIHWNCMNLMELDALIWCYYVFIHCVTEEGTRMARAECEDGAIYIHILGGRDPYGTGGVRRRCYIYHIGRKGPVWHGRSAKTVLWYTYNCILTDDWERMVMCEKCVHVCVTLGVCWMCYRIWQWNHQNTSLANWNEYHILGKSVHVNQCITWSVMRYCIMRSIIWLYII